MPDRYPPTIDPSQIKGNVSDNVKKVLSNPGAFYNSRGGGQGKGGQGKFCQDITSRLVVTEARIENKREDENRKEAIVVIEVDVTPEMANGGGNLHGGCIGYLVDVTTTLALFTYNAEVDQSIFAGVSQTMNIVYHAPAAIGDRLRIVNYTVAAGSRAKTARCEIWNATHHRLVASGMHTKMQPSMPKPKL